MHRLLQINVTANWGSTGRIAEGIGECAINNGWESWIAYGRGDPTSKSNLIRIGSDFDMRMHGIQNRLFDNHGLVSKNATKLFIDKIKEINPDIIHLHNIHGYFINYELLFNYLKEWGGPVVWTLHDCWPFTGHCAYYTYANCNRWQTQCYNCPQSKSYPSSLLLDKSETNFRKKREAFLGLQNMTLVPVSEWLKRELSKSFLKEYPTLTIHNGIDTDVFRPTTTIKKDNNSHTLLGVASVWDKRKGLDEFVHLRRSLPPNYTITLIGLSNRQISKLPDGITGIQRTENLTELAHLYSEATVFVNPTLEDNFPTTNLEALACGTPVITYNTGGSPESIDNKTGIIVPYKDRDSLVEAIRYACEKERFSSVDCRNIAETKFNKQKAFMKYINLYNSLL